MVDPLLSKRSVVILEQVHTRTLWSDTVLGLLKMILPHRKDLRLVISIPASAEGMVAQLRKYFSSSVNGADIAVLPFNTQDVRVPVETYYLQEPCTNYLDKTLETIIDLYKNPGDKYKDGGDILVFMPTKRDVQELIQRASNELQASNAIFMPYHSSVSVSQYQVVMSDDYTGEGIWRIIVTNDLADDDYDLLSKGRICFIIDCGIRMMTETNLENRLRRDTLLPISTVRAESRRLMASSSDVLGKCYRLYTESYYSEMAKFDFPEHFYVDLTEFALRVMSLTIPNVATDFPYLAPAPPVEALSYALEKLYYLKATNAQYELTREGAQMADSHLPVMLARAVVAGSELGCIHEMLSIAGMVLAGGIDAAYFDPSGKDERAVARAEHEKFQVKEGDHLTLLNIYESFTSKGNSTTKWTRERYLNYRTLLRAQGIRTQVSDYLKKQGILHVAETKSKRNIEDRICQSICKGFFLNAAKRTISPDGTTENNTNGYFYKLLNQKLATGEEEELVVQSHHTSVQDIDDLCVVYEELVEVPSAPADSALSPSTSWQLKGVTAVKSAWLLDTHYYKELKSE